MANKLKVNILSREYTLISEDSPEYMKRIAEATGHKMQELLDNNPAWNTTMVSVLTALNLADELEKVKQIAREKVDAQAAEIASLKKQLEDIKKRPQNKTT